MALNGAQGDAVARLAGFGLVTADAEAAAAFYEAALGCRRLGRGRRVGAECLTLGLGRETIGLIQFDQPGRPYPRDSSAADLIFQHLAVVVTDMAAVHRRLTRIGGWRPISQGGPRRLPASSGGVTAFKFRDPEGHPLELLAFPEQGVPSHWRAVSGGDPCLGIDHSAISIADTPRSIAFYEALGLKVAVQTLNRGPEQALLDGLVAPVVEVTAIAPAQSTPHIELLCYRSAAIEPRRHLRRDDIAASRLFLATDARTGGDGADEGMVIDPDGHRLLIGGTGF